MQLLNEKEEEIEMVGQHFFSQDRVILWFFILFFCLRVVHKSDWLLKTCYNVVLSFVLSLKYLCEQK